MKKYLLIACAGVLVSACVLPTKVGEFSINQRNFSIFKMVAHEAFEESTETIGFYVNVGSKEVRCDGTVEHCQMVVQKYLDANPDALKKPSRDEDDDSSGGSSGSGGSDDSGGSGGGGGGGGTDAA